MGRAKPVERSDNIIPGGSVKMHVGLHVGLVHVGLMGSASGTQLSSHGQGRPCHLAPKRVSAAADDDLRQIEDGAGLRLRFQIQGRASLSSRRRMAVLRGCIQDPSQAPDRQRLTANGEWPRFAQIAVDFAFPC